MSSRLKNFSPGTEPPENDDVGRGVLPESENENPFEQKFVSKALSKRKLAATGERELLAMAGQYIVGTGSLSTGFRALILVIESINYTLAFDSNK